MATSPDYLEAEILVAHTVSPEQAQAVADAFAALGVVARTRVIPTRRGAAELSWLILATLPLHAFLTGLGSKLAEDAYQRLRGLVHRILPNRSQPTAPAQVLVLQDATTRLQIVLGTDLPHAAYQQLFALDLSTIQHGPLHYDRHNGRWRSEFDEAARRQPPPP